MMITSVYKGNVIIKKTHNLWEKVFSDILINLVA